MISGSSGGTGGSTTSGAANLSGLDSSGTALEDNAAKDWQSAAPESTSRQVVSTGSITLQSEDIADSRAEAIAIIERAGGHVDNEDSLSGDDGAMQRSDLILRVPAKRFSAVMEELAQIADTVRQTRRSEDVTTTVIDVEARIRVQKSSIRRLELLYSRATTIGQIISLEGQLSRRQAELDSLEQRQAWLQGQTSLATIEVSIVEPGKAKPIPEDERHGFLKGLYAGWDALVTLTTGFLAAVGATLPFLGALILLLLGYRTYRWMRR